MNFEKLMCIATKENLQMSVDIMQKYVVCPTALKTMMHMLHDELDKGD